METIQIISMMGFAISTYFLLVYKGLLGGIESILPAAVCSKNSCNAVLETPFSRVFKIPNFILGIFYYSAVFLYPFFAHIEEYLFISALVSLFSLYLAYTLLYRLKTQCILCFVSHGINISITMILALKI